MASPSVNRRMRTAHAARGKACACGRTLLGNGWKAHARVCPDFLAKAGWPLDRSLAVAIGVERGVAAVQAAEKAVAEKVLARRAAGNLAPPSWEEVKGWAWAAADPPHTAGS